jgi:hypothetical protein
MPEFHFDKDELSFHYDGLFHAFYVNQAREPRLGITVSDGEIRIRPVTDADKQRWPGEYAAFLARHPEMRPRPVAVPDIRTENEARLRVFFSSLHPDLRALVRSRLLAATHTSPSAEGAVTAVLRDFGLLEPKVTP